MLAELATFAALAGSPLAAQSPPNVILITVDDLDLRFSLDVRRPDTGAYAYPNLRALQARGARFENAFVSHSLCAPSRASILTGQYAHNHGVLGNDTDGYGYFALDSTNTLPVWLQRAGYYTIHVGKYLNGYPLVGQIPGTQWIPSGWTRWFTLLQPSNYFGYIVNDDGGIVYYGFGASEYQTDVLARRAAGFVVQREFGDRPFFLELDFGAPHDGLPAGVVPPTPAPRHAGVFANYLPDMPPSYDEADVSDKPPPIAALPPLSALAKSQILIRLRLRCEAMLAVDEALGLLHSKLQATGELEDTVFLFVSDNGHEHGHHRIESGKGRPYGESIRVPLIVSGRGIPSGLCVTELAVNIDLAPTIVELCGAQAGRVPDGRSLVPLLHAAPVPWRTSFLIESTPQRAYVGVRTREHTYVEYDFDHDGSVDARELYMLGSGDPFELTSRHADPLLGVLRAELAARLLDLRKCAGASCR